ncbi:hypothetical protein BDV19DRAFT_379277 [Aspergillus venezuelensis]
MTPRTVLSVAASDAYFNLGSFARKITTTSADAQIWFNRGLTWVYSFNHVEGAYCFDHAIAHDPRCAMAYWGLAYAVGPNYNKPWESFDLGDLHTSVQRGYDASRLATKHAINATPLEQALVETMQARYPTREPAVDYSAVNRSYADAMKLLYESFGEDLDVATLYADALMNITKPQSADTLEIKAIEMSPTPEQGINAADYLRDLVPDAGHVHHMPSHLDILVGDWRRSIASNYKSTLADDKYFDKFGAQNFYTFYRMHDYHSLIYAAMFAGKSKTALDAVSRMEATIPEEELKAKPLPHDQTLYAATTATTHYARGIAFAATGNVASARAEQALFQQAYARVPETRRVYNGKHIDALKVAAAMLEGEIEYRAANYDQAFAALRRAIELEDQLPYSEPWSWMQPVRHAYAALLMEQGHLEDAAAIYRADLGSDASLIRPQRHPNNVWALQGYYECLQRLGRTEEAAVIEQPVKLALAVADIPIKVSCFCRVDTSP